MSSTHNGGPIVADDRCGCRHCTGLRARELGFVAPYTNEQWLRVAPSPIPPSPDPVRPAVAKQLAKLERPLAEAEAEVDEALERFTAAEVRWVDASRRAQVAEAGVGGSIGVSGSYIPASAESRAALAIAREAEAVALQDRQEADEALRRARVRHAALEARRHDLGRLNYASNSGVPVGTMEKLKSTLGLGNGDGDA
jgi:hypothetical protein